MKKSLKVRVKDVNLIYCSPENIPRYQNFYNVWVHIDLSMNVLIPFLIMIASSIVIVTRILKSTQNLGLLKNGGGGNVVSFSRGSNSSVANVNRAKSIVTSEKNSRGGSIRSNKGSNV